MKNNKFNTLTARVEKAEELYDTLQQKLDDAVSEKDVHLAQEELDKAELKLDRFNDRLRKDLNQDDNFAEKAFLLASKKKTSHLLHLILSFVTCGLWLPVWFVIADQNSGHNAKLDRKITGKRNWAGIAGLTLATIAFFALFSNFGSV